MKWTESPPCASASSCSCEGQGRLCDWAPRSRAAGQEGRLQPPGRGGGLSSMTGGGNPALGGRRASAHCPHQLVALGSSYNHPGVTVNEGDKVSPAQL